MSEADRYFLEKKLIIEGWNITHQAFVESLGSEKALEKIKSYVRMSGEAFVHNMTKLFGIKGDDFERIAEIDHLAEVLFNADYQEIEWTSRESSEYAPRRLSQTS
ncbi:MAG: hypothetical protein ABSB83_03280 [Methanomassiliicoccales archaeon]|jgi:hypothetical protein